MDLHVIFHASWCRRNKEWKRPSKTIYHGRRISQQNSKINQAVVISEFGGAEKRKCWKKWNRNKTSKLKFLQRERIDGGIQEFSKSFRCNICRKDWSILYYQSKETDSNNVSKSILQTEKTLGSTGNDRTICPWERKGTAYLGFRTSIFFFPLPMGIRFFILPALTLSVQSKNIINHSSVMKMSRNR